MPIEEISKNGKPRPVALRRTIQSEAVQEFVSRNPGFLILHGTTLFLILFVFIIGACWFIQYPEVISASAKLESLNAPKPVVNKVAGKLVKLFVKEGDSVSEKSIIGYMESTAMPENVLHLSQSLDSIHTLITDAHLEQLPSFIASLHFENLGELQQPYQNFMQAFLIYKDYIGNGFYARKKSMLETDLNNLKKLHTNLDTQKAIQHEDQTLAQKTFEMNETLLKEKVISLKEYRDERSKLLNKSLAVPEANSSIISNENAQNDKNKEMLELENTALQQQIVFIQALNTLKSQTEDWKQKYLLLSPADGVVSFPDFLQEKQELKANQTVCYIKPANTAYYAEVFIPQSNFGKVKINQPVLLKFQAYPYEQYGSVIGKLEFISPIPSDSGYAAKVRLPEGLRTNYGKQIEYRDGLISNAQIITQNMRLLQRFYYDIARQIKR
ncbi:HlyD family secretion protein [Parafilimonas sp.]|uniref:HlyD family secretion protein n=1 Tax=Parafilimonas sp. TaxID=1969739 RepID=UPI0039E561CA